MGGLNNSNSDQSSDPDKEVITNADTVQLFLT